MRTISNLFERKWTKLKYLPIFLLKKGKRGWFSSTWPIDKWIKLVSQFTIDLFYGMLDHSSPLPPKHFFLGSSSSGWRWDAPFRLGVMLSILSFDESIIDYWTKKKSKIKHNDASNDTCAHNTLFPQKTF